MCRNIKRFALLLAGYSFLALMSTGAVHAYSGAGSGTELEPYLISSCSEFNEISDDADAYYELSNDIECNVENELDVDYFEGTLDGGGYTIEFNQNSDGSPNMGLFGDLGGASVSDLIVIGSIVSNQQYAGLLAGASGGSTINNVHVVGSVSSTSDYVGGMFGFSGCSADVNDSSAVVDVEGNEYVGGFTGLDGCEGPGTTYSDSYAEGAVNGSSYVGGFVGSAFITKMYNVYASGNVTAVDNIVGGVSGEFGGFGDAEASEWWGVMHEVHSTGDVSGNDYVGGIFGRSTGGDIGASIDRTYTEGAVSGYQYVGGFGGLHEVGLIDESYAMGDVISNGYNAGGFLGEVRGPDVVVSNAYATGDVNLEGSYGGGFVGTIYDGQITNSYAAGDVTITGEGNERAGSFTAESFEDEGADVGLTNNFGAGAVSAPVGAGGFIGLYNDVTTFENNYWDVYKSGVETCKAGADVDGCTGVNVDNSDPNYFINNSANSPLDEWNFAEDLWMTQENSYPCFAWQDVCQVAEIDEAPADTDSDTIADSTESAAPNSGDANNDGTPDSEQANVASFVNEVSGEYSVLEVSEECTITSVEALAEADVSNPSDSDYNYPAGMLDFVLDCGEEGFTATITQYHYGITGDFLVRKYKPSTGYFTIDTASTSNQTIDNQPVKVATYQVQDGSNLDLDSEANGTIEDPAGLGEATEVLADTGENIHPIYLTAALTLLIAGVGIAESKKIRSL